MTYEQDNEKEEEEQKPKESQILNQDDFIINLETGKPELVPINFDEYVNEFSGFVDPNETVRMEDCEGTGVPAFQPNYKRRRKRKRMRKTGQE